MAMESFTELLHKLKDVHEQELEGLHQKVLELTNKKNCDAKRLEELYNRNQQLREQHKMLTENIKQLENMLRAGLCDRCTVTQEMAKKRQQDYETSHLQSLQHISILMGEISALMKENERLKAEVKSLRGRIDKQNGHKEEASSPEVKPFSEPAATTRIQMTSVLKNDKVAPEGATTPKATVKTEPERSLNLETLAQREGTPEKASEHKMVKGWSGTQTFEMTKQTNLATSQSSWKERRAASVESLDPRQSHTTHPFPPHLCLLKNNSLHSPHHSEERPVSVSVPLRPHPIKTSPANLPWHVPEQSEWVTVGTIASESDSIMVHKHDFSPTILRFPSLVPSECRPPVQNLLFPRPICPPAMSLFDMMESKSKKTTPGDWTGSQPERIFGENLRKAEEEVPLDLSNVRGSKMREKDSASSSSSSPPAPLSSPSSAQYASSPQSNSQAGDSKSQREDCSEMHKDNGEEEKEKNKNVEIENLKVPTLTISLRPVVLLESLKSTSQKEEEMEQDSELLDQPEKNNQGIIRKRSGESPEALPRHTLKLKKTRMTVVAQGSNNDDSDQG